MYRSACFFSINSKRCYCFKRPHPVILSLMRFRGSVLSIKKMLTSSSKPWWPSFKECSCKDTSPFKNFFLLSSLLFQSNLNLSTVFLLFLTYLAGQEIKGSFIITANKIIFLKWLTCNGTSDSVNLFNDFTNFTSRIATLTANFFLSKV